MNSQSFSEEIEQSSRRGGVTRATSAGGSVIVRRAGELLFEDDFFEEARRAFFFGAAADEEEDEEEAEALMNEFLNTYGSLKKTKLTHLPSQIVRRRRACQRRRVPADNGERTQRSTDEC